MKLHTGTLELRKKKYNYWKRNKQMLIIFSLYLPLPSTAREIQKFKTSSFFPNSSSKPNFTNTLANSNYICPYIVFDLVAHL